MLQGITGLILLLVGMFKGEVNWFIASGIFEIASVLSYWKEESHDRSEQSRKESRRC